MIQTSIRERPILFTPAMAAAVAAGRKTQTRRIVKLRDKTGTYSAFDDDGWPTSMDDAGDWHRDPCPYGKPGDRLYVREAWYYDLPPHRLPSEKPADFDPDHLYYSANGECCEQIPECQCASAEVGKPKWKPGIHLPRWACRSVLEVVSVRVERVESITEADAIAEGCPILPHKFPKQGFDCARDWFLHLFYSINKRAPEGSNPSVWVIAFRKVAAS